MATEFCEEDTIYLNLSSNPIRFEPVSKVTNVFYDDANQQVSQFFKILGGFLMIVRVTTCLILQVFAVRSGGATGVVCKGQKDNLNCTFRMEDKGAVLSIKFSPDQKVLAVQRSAHSVVSSLLLF